MNDENRNFWVAPSSEPEIWFLFRNNGTEIKVRVSGSKITYMTYELTKEEEEFLIKYCKKHEDTKER